MTVDEFKTIFWWNGRTGCYARGIGVIFALPLFFFWITGRIERRLRLPLLGSWRSAVFRDSSAGGWYPPVWRNRRPSASTGLPRI